MTATTFKLALAHRAARIALAVGAIAGFSGCQAAELVGGMVESYKRSSTRTIAAEYEGLVDKDFAVLLAADRSIQSAHPQVVPRLTTLITERLASNADASGVVPAGAVLQFQFNRPSWSAMTYGELTEEFGVDRLIVIDLYEYRLHEPGNAYLWEGSAAAQVGVVEADGPLGDDFAFTKRINVAFPDSRGYGKADLTATQVSSVLQSRFTDRVSWLFYEHEEPYYPEY